MFENNGEKQTMETLNRSREKEVFKGPFCGIISLPHAGIATQRTKHGVAWLRVLLTSKHGDTQHIWEADVEGSSGV